jgi:hypothetical protein
MAAPSTVYLAKFSDSGKADKVRLLTANDVGRCFRNLLKTSGLRLSEGELQTELGVSAEALERLLDSIGSSTVGGLKRFLEESGGVNLDEYAILKRQYEKKRLNGFNLGLYFIDRELLLKRGGISALHKRPKSARERIKIMLSAILWIKKLGCSREKHQWKKLFISFKRGRLHQDLRLLWGAWLLRFLKNKSELSIPGETQKRLDRLWKWFDTHDQRAIKLAFCMSREGLLLEAFGKMGAVHRFIDEVERL